MTSVLDPFETSCRLYPDRVAIVDQAGTSVTYGDLEKEARALSASWQTKGLRPGQKVLVATPVSVALYRSLLAIWFAGCEAIFPEPFAGIRGVRHACKVLRPAAVVASFPLALAISVLTLRPLKFLSPDAASAEETGASREVPPAPIALYSFTSGSTGAPKCIPRSHDFLLHQQSAVANLLASDGHETELIWFPVFVLACLANANTAILANSPLKNPGTPDTEALARQCRQHGATRLLAPPTVAHALSQEKSMPRLRQAFTGGGPVMPWHFESIGTYADETVAVYGSTEAEPISVLSSHDVTPDMLDAAATGAGLPAGKPVANIEVRIIDDEILVAGPHVVETYLDPVQNVTTKTVEDGKVWHHTGDAGCFDADGNLWLWGRVSGRVGAHWPFRTEVQVKTWPGVEAAALLSLEGQPAIAVAGSDGYLQDWHNRAAAMDLKLIIVDEIPFDRRHASKIDYTRLQALSRTSQHRR